MQPELDKEFVAAFAWIGFRYIARGILIIAGIILLISGYASIADRVRFDNVDNLFVGSKKVKEAYFTQSRPSAQAVEDYLSDATILVSDPQNLVAYFRGSQNFDMVYQSDLRPILDHNLELKGHAI